MKKRKVLDPFRIAPEPAPKPTREQRAQLAEDPDSEAEVHCVQFRGIRCGLNVWLDYKPAPDDQPTADALEQLHALLCDLFDADLSVALNAYGVYRDAHPDDMDVWPFYGKFYIKVAEGADPIQKKAVTTLCKALRAVAAVHPVAVKELKYRKIKPYVS